MDHQAQLMERVGQGILQVAAREEQMLDEQLRKMENLDEDDFEALRQKRKLNLQKQMRQEQEWRQVGHGRYAELNDTKEFFHAAKKSARMIVHFYRSVTPRCEIVDAHFERLSNQHIEARFVKVDVEKSPFLVEKLGIILIPTIVLIKDGKTDHSIRGFDEFGGTDGFSTQDMEFVLYNHGMLNCAPDRSEEIGEAQANRLGVNQMQMKIRGGEYDHLSDDEDNFNLDDV